MRAVRRRPRGAGVGLAAVLAVALAGGPGPALGDPPAPVAPGSSPAAPASSPAAPVSAPGSSPAAPASSPAAPGSSPAAPGSSPAAPASSPAAPASSPAAPASSPALRCASAGVAAARLVHDHHFVNAHVVAQTIDALCQGAAAPPAWRVWDAIALVHLDERPRARLLLDSVLTWPALAPRARILAAWSFLADRDDRAFRAALAGLPAGPRARLQAMAALGDPAPFARAASRLDPALAARAAAVEQTYQDARQKSPLWAGTLSAVLPGAGQAYAGAWDGALLSLALNALAIGATVELGRKHLYVSAALTGTAASIFYVGNILDAADLARRKNRLGQDLAREQAEILLVPEASP